MNLVFVLGAQHSTLGGINMILVYYVACIVGGTPVVINVWMLTTEEAA